MPCVITYPFGNDGNGLTTDDLSAETEGQEPKLGKGAISVAANWDSIVDDVAETPTPTPPRQAPSSKVAADPPGVAFDDDRSIRCGTPPEAIASSLADPDNTVDITEPEGRWLLASLRFIKRQISSSKDMWLLAEVLATNACDDMVKDVWVGVLIVVRLVKLSMLGSL